MEISNGTVCVIKTAGRLPTKNIEHYASINGVKRLMRKLLFAMLFGIVSLFNAPVQADLAAVGLPHPTNHFPTWISDTNNLALQLCLDGDGITGICTFDPPDPTNPWSVTTGFGVEAFYNRATARITIPGSTRRIDYGAATEVSYLSGIPKDGDQFVFGRVRFRVDTPGSGTYRVFHPYLTFPGCTPESFTVGGGGRAINITRDVGGGAPFATVLTGEVGPFLKWDPAIPPAAPIGYIGDPQVTHAITGSKCNINFFRVEGPNIGGPGINAVQTTAFNVQGKIFNAATTPAPLVIDRATYTRSGGTTRVNVFAQSSATATLTLSSVLGEPAGAMTSDGAGNFYRQVSGAAVPPASVTVTATSPTPGVPVTVQTLPLTDSVNVDPAVYTQGTQSLSITASSSDITAPPTLTAKVGARSLAMPPLDATGKSTLIVPAVVTPPTDVTVTSNKGGKDSEAIAD